MTKTKNASLYFLLLTAFVLSSVLVSQNSYQPINLSKQETALNINKDLYSILSLGQKRLITDFLWVTTLIESDHEHYKKKDLNSWMYHRFDSLLTLDPRFLSAYQFGGQYLSVIKDDIDGATDIYNRGLEVYPNDYKLNFYGGAHHQIELKDYKRAIELYEKILHYPQASRFLPIVVAKLKANTYSLLDSYKFLIHILENTDKESPMRKKYLKDIEELELQIRQNCSKRNILDC